MDKESTPTVDVLLPFHRVDKFLIQSIESVMESESVQIRLVLLNNLKIKDSNRQLLENYLKLKRPNYIEVLVPGLGTYAEALNLARSYLKSDFFALANSDDLIAQDRIWKQITSMGQDCSDISICKLRKFSNLTPILPSLTKSLKTTYTGHMLLLGAYGADATLVGRKQWLVNSSNFKLVDNADWIFALENYEGSKISFLDKKKYFYRIHRNQNTQNKPNFNSNTLLISLLQDKYKAMLGHPVSSQIIEALAFPGRRRIPKNLVPILSGVIIEMVEAIHDEVTKREFERLLARRLSIGALRQPTIFLTSHFRNFRQILDFCTLVTQLPFLLFMRIRN